MKNRNIFLIILIVLFILNSTKISNYLKNKEYVLLYNNLVEWTNSLGKEVENDVIKEEWDKLKDQLNESYFGTVTDANDPFLMLLDNGEGVIISDYSMHSSSSRRSFEDEIQIHGNKELARKTFERIVNEEIPTLSDPFMFQFNKDYEYLYPYYIKLVNGNTVCILGSFPMIAEKEK